MKSRNTFPQPRVRTEFASRFSPLLTMALGLGVLLNPPGILRADITISGGTFGGPQTGDGGNFTVTSTGEIRSGGEGVVATGTDILALSVDGLVDAYSNGININTGGTLPSIGIAGTVGGGWSALINSGTVGSLTAASGAQINAPGGTGIYNEGTFTGTILNGGTIAGYGSALFNSPAGQIAALTNTGTLTADYAVRNAGTITTLTNQASGSLQGGGYGVVVESGGSIGTLTNAGAISGYNGIVQVGAITTLENSGSITGSVPGISLAATASLGTFTNSGTVSGGTYGLQAPAGSTIGTITNSGTFSGYNAFESAAATGTISNLAGGLITAASRGLGQYAPLTLLENAGTITANLAVITAADIGTIDNQAGGRISGGERGLLLNGVTNTVTTILNAGTIQANTAIENYGNITTLTNSNSINGTAEWGILHRSGTIGTLTNTAAGTISGAYGIGVSGAAGTIDNGGLIEGTANAVRVESTGTITLLSNSGTLAGRNAIEHYGNLTTLTNTGAITASGDWGIYHANGTTGTLTNAATGSISATGHGIGIFNSTVGTIDTAGRVAGTNGFGINLANSTLTNLTNSGVISGGNQAINAESATTIGSITNSGTIESGSHAMVLNATGTITNTATGLISSTTSGHGIAVLGDTGLIANAGTISGSAYGIIGLGGTLTAITNTGTIEGSSGIHSEYRPFGTITNSGTITGTEHGMVLHDTGTITNAATGVISSTVNLSAIYLYGNNDLISNDGQIIGASQGILKAGGTLNTLSNAGSITAATNGIESYGIIGTLTNSGTISGAGDWGIYQSGNSIGTLTNAATGSISATGNGVGIPYATVGTIDNAGLIEGTNGHGMYLEGINLTNQTNSGTIRGGYQGISAWGSTIGSITNSGTIEAVDSAMQLGTTGTITNTSTGSIRSTGTGHGIAVYGDTGLIANDGLISGAASGIGGYGGTLAAITNTGTIKGTIGVLSDFRTFGTVTNSGIIEGTEYGMMLHDTGTVDNAPTGVIRSTVSASAIFLYGNTSQISNDGLISGVTEGIAQATGLTTTLTNTGRIEGGSTALSISGTTEKIINTGVIAYTGAGTGPALVVGPGGVLGDATGTRGPALESTGASALLSGRIVIEGTIYHGFTIENQNVEVSAAGGTGTFSGGTLNVADGNLSLLDGRINLGSDISVTGGSGSVFNESTLAFSGAPTIHGNFTQLNVGSLISVFDGTTTAALSIDGVANFDGAFGLELDESSLKDNQTFNLLMFDSYLGQFSTFSINGNALASAGPGRWSHNSFILKEEWSSTTMKIIVTAAPASVPEPGTTGVASLLVGFGFAISRRRTPSKS